MTFLIRHNRGGRCPACGEQHAACGPPSGVTPFDIPEEVAAVGGPLRKYRFVSPSGAETVLKLNETDAERQGLTDDDLVDAGNAPTAAASAPAGKARTRSAHKARTGAQNKGATPAGGTGGGG